MKTITLIIMVAIVLEGLVEYGKTIEHMFTSRDYKTAITQCITIVLGIALAFIFNLQLFNHGLSEIYSGLTINANIDMILTGILFSRGSNYFSDLISRLQKKGVTENPSSEKIDDLDVIPEDEFIDEVEDDIDEEELENE